MFIQEIKNRHAAGLSLRKEAPLYGWDVPGHYVGRDWASAAEYAELVWEETASASVDRELRKELLVWVIEAGGHDEALRRVRFLYGV